MNIIHLELIIETMFHHYRRIITTF